MSEITRAWKAKARSDAATSGSAPSWRAAYCARALGDQYRLELYTVKNRKPRGLRITKSGERPSVLAVRTAHHCIAERN